jgi:drug/metabolite transporter (DMT)-like permease
LLFAAVLGERHPRGAWIGVIIALVGAVIFLFDSRNGGSSLYGNLVSTGAAMAMAAYWLVNRPLVAKYPATTVSAFTTLFGTIPLLIIGLPDARAQDWGALETRHWLALIYMAIFPIYLVYIGNNWVISKRGVTATSANLAVPVVSGILAVLILDEPLSAVKIIGAAIVLAGLVMIQRTRIRAARHAKAPETVAGSGRHA